MPYSTDHRRPVRNLHRAVTCPYLLSHWRCAGGDYCAYPPGRDRRCCFICPFFERCPDNTGVCVRFGE